MSELQNFSRKEWGSIASDGAGRSPGRATAACGMHHGVVRPPITPRPWL